MSWADATRLFRSFALRTALLTAAGVLGISAFGLGLGWLRSSAALQDVLDRTITAEADQLLREYRRAGPVGLARAVEARMRDTTPSAILVMLRAADGGRLAGAAALEVAPLPLRGFVTGTPTGIPTAGADGPLRLLGVPLPGGLTLIVAAEMRAVLDTAATLASTQLMTGVVAVAMALGFGLFTAWRLERRLRAISAAAADVMRGDLSRRLPLAGTTDEFDRLTATMNALLARVEALMQGLRQVTVDVAHDLRGPLSRLRQRLEAALAQPRDAPTDTATIEAALGELDAVLASFAALLRIAQLEAASPGAAPQPVVDLSALVTTLTEAYAVAAEEAGKALSADIVPGQTVRGDAGLLRQLLANLVDNALAHGGPGIRVTLRPGPILEVADNGPGVPPAEREAVLRRFYRLDRSRGTPGSGLGLAIVAAAARWHGATLHLADAAPGLRVTVDLSPAAS